MTIVRIWRGVTVATTTEQYVQYLNKIVIPAYPTAEGNEGTLAIRDLWSELASFLLLSFWSLDEALVRFEGANSNEIVDPTPKQKVFSWPSSQPPGNITSFTRPNHYMLNNKR